MKYSLLAAEYVNEFTEQDGAHSLFAPEFTEQAGPHSLFAPDPALTEQATPLPIHAPDTAHTRQTGPLSLFAHDLTLTRQVRPLSLFAPDPALTGQATPLPLFAPDPALTQQSTPLSLSAPNPAITPHTLPTHAPASHLVLALDPGRDKSGFAFTDLHANLLLSGIFPSNEHQKFFSAVLNHLNLAHWSTEGNPNSLSGSILFIAIGNGTHSQSFTQKVKASLPFEILIVDEHNTTLEARKLYWQIHKPSLFMRLLPEGMRVPPRMLDDLAAWAIAIRAVKKYRDMRPNKL